jgi:hypothetical protein
MALIGLSGVDAYGNYYNYNNSIGDIASTLTASAAATTTAVAQGGLDSVADVAALSAEIAIVSALFTQWFSHPAADTRNIINTLKPDLVSLSPYDRLVHVIAAAQKMPRGAEDVVAKEWLLWYIENYPNDYKQLTVSQKQYWNNYLNSIRSSFPNGNNMYANLSLASFTPAELNYTAPMSVVSNLFSSSTTGGSSNNLLLIGGAAILLILLLKK